MNLLNAVDKFIDPKSSNIITGKSISLSESNNLTLFSSIPSRNNISTPLKSIFSGHILRKEKLLCTIDDAVEVHNLIDAVNQVNRLTQKEKERRGLCH